MLEMILKLYVMAIATGVTSPVPHLFGPPGCGKSTVVHELGKLVDKTVHVINVSRISPLELEGVQMPTTDEEGKQLLKLLLATHWNKLKPGDIILWDELLRGFPEVFNGLLDIITSRKVEGFDLPPVFMIAASNTTIAYDSALADRLLHLPVPDPRNDKKASRVLADMIVGELGLHSKMAASMEMQALLQAQVYPMFGVLDDLKNGVSSGSMAKGQSVRKLIGQAQLREVQAPELAELLDMNNRKAMQDGYVQCVFLPDGKAAVSLPSFEDKAIKLKGNKAAMAKLSPVQRTNLDLNLQLIEMERIRHEKKKGTEVNDDDAEFLDV